MGLKSNNPEPSPAPDCLSMRSSRSMRSLLRLSAIACEQQAGAHQQREATEARRPGATVRGVEIVKIAALHAAWYPRR